MKLYFDLLQMWTCYSEILDNIATVVKQFKRYSNVHKGDKFNGKMSYVLGLSYSCFIPVDISY